jgi:hypothetical protein
MMKRDIVSRSIKSYILKKRPTNGKGYVIPMKILSLSLSTTTLSKMKHFYLEQLGFSLKHESNDSFTIFAGRTELTFTQDDSVTNRYYHFAMDIPHNQIEEAQAWLWQKGCHPLDTTSEADSTKRKIIFFENINAHSIYFMDPQGNVLEFIARKNLNNASNKSFDALSIINISEIGFGLNQDVNVSIKRLSSQFGVTPFGTGDGKIFQILGDDHGTFILSDTSRAWFPTSRSVEIHPIHMTIEGEKPSKFQLTPYPYYIETVN